MAQVHVPRSLAALFPGVPRRLEVPAHDLAGVILELDARYPGMWDRLCEPGPRLRRHINAFVDSQPATLESHVGRDSVVHIIPAVAGGCRWRRATPDLAAMRSHVSALDTQEFQDIRDRQRASAGWDIGSTDLLLEERQERRL